MDKSRLIWNIQNNEVPYYKDIVASHNMLCWIFIEKLLTNKDFNRNYTYGITTKVF